MSWIWINDSEYQKNYCSLESPEHGDINKRKKYNYCVAEFKKIFSFEKEIESVSVKVSGDSFFMLFVNNNLEGIGPAAAGGDFLCREAAPKHYANNYLFSVDGKDIEFFARVRLLPEVLTDYSRGHGGFYLSGTVNFKDGTSEPISTDSTWLCRRNASYCGFQIFDGRIKSPEFENAAEIIDIWHDEDAPIPMLSLNNILPQSSKISAEIGETKTSRIFLDKIYGVYPKIKADGSCKITVKTSELENQEERIETAVFSNSDEYLSFRMHSAGTAEIILENTGEKSVTAEVSFVAPWYPIENEGEFKTSSCELNKIYDVCKHTLKICRQTLHLDSTKHQELLACTGDYYIESLMTQFCFGDMRLSEFDLMRTSDWLVKNEGVMFHTTYSLIWVQMLHDVYMITGNIELLKYCRKGLETLLERFESYIGENNVIDNPPDFMFVDWTVIDGFSMHHPPKALGQTVLNAFYYKALCDASKIYAFLGESETEKNIAEKAENFRVKFNEIFFDKEKNLYFDGLGTPYGGEKFYHPANVDKKYFSKYPNILAALYGLCDEEQAADIIERIIFDDELQDIQPYFMHYMLCAVRKCGLFEKYGMKLLSRWSDVVNECDKGLKEGWIAPEESYSFDHSHAWGGTPAYQMPAAITGLKILEPGMKKISFEPNLFGLDFAEIKIPTSYGMIYFRAEKGKETIIEAPKCIEIL